MAKNSFRIFPAIFVIMSAILVSIITSPSPSIQSGKFKKITKNNNSDSICVMNVFGNIVGTDAGLDLLNLIRCSAMCSRDVTCVGYNYVKSQAGVNLGMCKLVFSSDLLGFGGLYYSRLSGCFFYQRLNKVIKLVDQAPMSGSLTPYHYIVSLTTGDDVDAATDCDVKISMSTLPDLYPIFFFSLNQNVEGQGQAGLFGRGQTDVFDVTSYYYNNFPDFIKKKIIHSSMRVWHETILVLPILIASAFTRIGHCCLSVCLHVCLYVFARLSVCLDNSVDVCNMSIYIPECMSANICVCV
ncbi:hypothetical protein HELRODRAFT_177055 [Helobdella robusta]|uniref:Uncharacterized protein n=1 Tax=Helobdella robusta TaxID=6412 RepID=T1FB66_HELRO|nr:hypothetical protein HELRODRAFT_177055 [Helobdella robusta]ESN98576.1 hypothetical protein HELRODRAFT_177055 [Helobdella robusta]